MMVWAIAGAGAGWLFAYRLSAVGFACVLAASALLPLLVLAITHHFDIDMLYGYGGFWLAMQAGYFLGNFAGRHVFASAASRNRSSGDTPHRA